jgi:hypothetical protein
LRDCWGDDAVVSTWVLDRSEDDHSTDSDSGSPSEREREKMEDDRDFRRKLKACRIPIRTWGKLWDHEQQDDFQKNRSHIKTFLIEC